MRKSYAIGVDYGTESDAHHTVFSYRVTAEQLVDWAELAGIECVLINNQTSTLQLRSELRWSDAAWRR